MRERLGALTQRLSVRLMIGLLAVALIPAIILAVVLTRSASSSLEDSAQEGLANAARGSAERIDDEIAERRSELRVLAADLGARGVTGERALAADLLPVAVRGSEGFRGFALTSLGGRPLVRAGAGSLSGVERQRFFESAASGRTAFGPVEFSGGGSRWLAATPVRDSGGRALAVLVGRMDRRSLDRIVAGQRFGESGEAIVRDSGQRVIGRARPRNRRSDAEAALGRRSETDAARRAADGRSGAVRYIDPGDNEVIGGFAPARSIGATVVVKQDESEAFEAVSDARNLAILLLILTAALAAGFATLFSNLVSRPIRRLAEAARGIASGDLSKRVEPEGTAETRELASSFNVMLDGLELLIRRLRDASGEMSTSATELSSASDELAATTSQQNAAATETSSTMEELAATSASIAENIEAIAEQTGETRAALAQADDDMQTSSARTLGLARRVDEIGGILELIDELADRTSLLALNAAIEAARAGESGSGFTVVADEVRKLAERSKQSSAEIAEIVAGTQAETNATVIAMETGSKQMRRGLELMESVATATHQARLTTEQQRAASVQVVEAMQSVTSASRQAASTAQQLADAAGGLSKLAEDLERTAKTTAREDAPEPGATAPGEGPPSAGDGGSRGREVALRSGRRDPS